MREREKWKGSRSVVSNSSRPHGLQPTRLLHPRDFPGKSTGVGCHRLLRWKLGRIQTMKDRREPWCYSFFKMFTLRTLLGKQLKNLSILASWWETVNGAWGRRGAGREEIWKRRELKLNKITMLSLHTFLGTFYMMLLITHGASFLYTTMV